MVTRQNNRVGVLLIAGAVISACGDSSQTEASPAPEAAVERVVEATSTCPDITPMTIGQQRLYASLGPGPMANPPSVYPEDADFASDYFLQGYSPLIGYEDGMPADDAKALLRCFTTEEESASSVPPYLDAEEVTLFRTGGHTGEFDAVEYMLGTKDGVATTLTSARICDAALADRGVMGEFSYCPLEPDEAAKAAGFGQQFWRDEFFPPENPGDQIFGLYRGQSKSDALATLSERTAPEEGAEGYSAPVFSETRTPDGNVRVNWEQTGYMDDSVGGERLNLLFQPYVNRDGERVLQLRHLGWQQMCSRPGNIYWTTDKCP